MGAKFLITLYLSKIYVTGDYRDYTMILTFITLAIYFLGLDFYSFSIRDILVKQTDKLKKVVTTFFVYLLVYIIFILMAYLLFYKVDYLIKYQYYIIGVAITEHLSQEIYRLLIAFKKVLLANVILTFRTVGWTGYVVIYTYLNSQVSLQKLLLMWFLFNLVTIMILFTYYLFKYFNELITVRVDFLWIKKGIAIAGIYFTGTILLKSIEYVNRFILDYYVADIYVNIYNFYATIALLVSIYINTIVISFELPVLIAAVNTNDVLSKHIAFSKSIKKQLFIIIPLLSLAIIPVLFWQNKPDYTHYILVFYLILIGVSLMNYSLIYHYKLYILHKDYKILKTLIYSGISSLLIGFILIYLFGIYGAAISFMFSGVLLTFFRKKMADNYKLV